MRSNIRFTIFWFLQVALRLATSLAQEGPLDCEAALAVADAIAQVPRKGRWDRVFRVFILAPEEGFQLY